MNATKTADEDLAAAWGAEMETAPGEAGTRVLDQGAIDNLLGFSGAAADGESRGVLALVNSGLVNYERLPMLDVVFDRLVRMLSTSLRNLTSDNVEVTLDQIVSVRFGDYLSSLPMPALITVFRAEEWDNYGLLTVDSALIYSVVDVLLGGRRGTAAMRIEGRPYTTIERNIVERMLHVVLADLTAAFDPISAVTFKFDRLETNPRFATITRANNAAVLVKIRIDMDDRGGRLDLLIPYATLEPVRELLLQMFMGEKFGRDSIWESHLTSELYQTEMELRAVLGETSASLGSVLNWKVGTRIMLNSTPDSPVEMKCGERPMYEGRIGKRAGRIAVKITNEAKPESNS